MALSIRMMNLVWFASDKSGGHLLSQLYIADRSNDDGMDIWPSNRRVAGMTRQGVRTVQRHIDRFLKESWLLCDGNRRGGGKPGIANTGQPNVYRINPVWINAALAAMSRATRETHHVILTPSDWKQLGNSQAEHLRSMPNEASEYANRDSRSTPSFGTRTVLEPSIEPSIVGDDSPTREKPDCENCGERDAKLKLPGKRTLVCYQCWTNATGREMTDAPA
jgi:hypothetical protein